MKTNLTSEHGSALVELALMLPMVVLLFCGGIELARALVRFQIVSEANRAAALDAYRQCHDEQTNAAMNECLTDKVKNILYTVGGTPETSNIKLRISVYRKNGSVVSKMGEIATRSAPQSRFDANRVKEQLTSLTTDRSMVFIGESTSAFMPILPLFALELYEQIIV